MLPELGRQRQDRKPSLHGFLTTQEASSYPKAQDLCPPSLPGQVELLQIRAKEWVGHLDTEKP